jgi:hypothetical protein
MNVPTEDETIAPLEVAAEWAALWRALFLDIPLTWTMELSRFGSRELEEQVEHFMRLAACADVREVVDEQARFSHETVAELEEEAEALAREAHIAVAPD